MIFVDTNILMDVWEDERTPAAEWSRHALAREAGSNRLVSNLIVAAELSGQMEDVEALGQTLASADIELIDLDVTTAYRAGRAFREYRRRGGQRDTILPDFLIAAHAEMLKAALLTRDRGLASYFPDLTLITPETQP